MPKKKVVAIVCADIHLKHKPPICRWGEDDWYKAMKRSLRQLRELHKKHNAPILYAGDIFDRWNSPSQLVNFAIYHLPFGYAIPGQHDLPYHRYDLRTDSAYWTLVAAQQIEDLDPEHSEMLHSNGSIQITSFPWEHELKPEEGRKLSSFVRIALVHKLVWKGKPPFPGAPENQNAEAIQKQLKGFDIAVSGDNHQHFIFDNGKKPIIYNCGSLMRITADQLNFQPKIGLIWSDGSVSTVDVDISQDKFLAKAGKFVSEAEIPELKELAQEFAKITKRTVSFMEYLEDMLRSQDLSDEVKQVIINAMEVSKNG